MSSSEQLEYGSVMMVNIADVTPVPVSTLTVAHDQGSSRPLVDVNTCGSPDLLMANFRMAPHQQLARRFGAPDPPVTEGAVRGSELVRSPEARNITITNSYDDAGRPTARTYPGGAIIRTFVPCPMEWWGSESCGSVWSGLEFRRDGVIVA